MTFASQIAAVVSRSCPPLRSSFFTVTSAPTRTPTAMTFPSTIAPRRTRDAVRVAANPSRRAPSPEVEAEHGAGYGKHEPRPPRKADRRPSRSSSSRAREPRTSATAIDRRRCGLATRLVPRLVLAGVHGLLLADGRPGSFCLDRVRAARSRPDEAVRPHRARGVRDVHVDRDAPRDPARVRERRARSGKLRRRPRHRCGQPDDPPVPAARRSDRRPEGPPRPHRRRRADRGRERGGVLVRRLARAAHRVPISSRGSARRCSSSAPPR